jgi:hypothetical protein
LEREYAAQGIETKRMPVKVDQMVAWCFLNGYEIDGKGRAAFGASLTCTVIDNTRVKH